MIHNNVELKATQERIVMFAGWVAQLRVSVTQKNFHGMAEGYLAEIKKMHAEVTVLVTQHATS